MLNRRGYYICITSTMYASCKMYYCTFCKSIPYEHTEWENFKPQVVLNKNEIHNLQFFLYDTEIMGSHVVRISQVC